jgi:hypothetical protein
MMYTIIPISVEDLAKELQHFLDRRYVQRPPKYLTSCCKSEFWQKETYSKSDKIIVIKFKCMDCQRECELIE